MGFLGRGSFSSGLWEAAGVEAEGLIGGRFGRGLHELADGVEDVGEALVVFGEFAKFGAGDDV